MRIDTASPHPSDPRGPLPYLSVVLPAYRSASILERHVPRLLKHLDRLGFSYEVIVVDDGSDDAGQTEAVARSLGCLFEQNKTNCGKGSAVRRGMQRARGRFRIFTDADVPYELTSIDRFLHYLDVKEYHVVAGDRTLEESSYFFKVPLHRQVASHVYSFIVGRFIAGGWFDTQCGLKGFRGHVADDLFSVARVDRFAFDVELFYIALKRNYDIKRLPVRLRVQEGSVVSVMRDGAAMVADLGKIEFHRIAGHYKPTHPVILGLESTPRADDTHDDYDDHHVDGTHA
jgi:dolichyl-phosphate beta-glucosyltransferase